MDHVSMSDDQSHGNESSNFNGPPSGQWGQSNPAGFPPPPPQRSRTWLWIGLGVAVVLAIGGLLAGVLLLTGNSDSSDDASVTPAVESTSEAPSSEPTETPEDDPEPGDEGSEDESEGSGESLEPAPKLPLPQGSDTFNGKSAWTMQTSPDWVEFDIPGLAEEAAWATGDGVGNFGNNINVLTEKPAVTVDLPAYVDLSQQGLERLGAKIVSDDVYAAKDHDYGRIEYLLKTGKTRAHGVAYVSETPDGWVIATYSAAPSTFDRESPQVEPYLATVQGR